MAFNGAYKRLNNFRREIILPKTKRLKRAITPLFLYPKGSVAVNSIKKKSLKALVDGLSKFEDGRNVVKNSDFTDLKTFVKDYLNTPEPKQRRKLAEEFKKRHLELYAFIKENAELISAETEIAKTVQAALSGDALKNKQITNPFEALTDDELKGLIKYG